MAPLAVVALVLLAVGPSAAAQDADVTFERSPASGPPGTVIAVSGTGCLLGGEPAESALVSAANRLGTLNPPFGFFVEIPVQADGSWSGELPVPLDALPEEYGLGATCILQDQLFGASEILSFTVTGTGPTTSTSSTSTSSTSTSSTSTTLHGDPVVDPPRVAPPADPMPGTPRYTG